MLRRRPARRSPLFGAQQHGIQPVIECINQGDANHNQSKTMGKFVWKPEAIGDSGCTREHVGFGNEQASSLRGDEARDETETDL